MPLVDAPPTGGFSLLAVVAEEGAGPAEGLPPLLLAGTGGVVSMG